MQLERQLQEDTKSAWLDAHISIPQWRLRLRRGEWHISRKQEGGAQAMTDQFIDIFVQVSNIMIGAHPSWAKQTPISTFIKW